MRRVPRPHRPDGTSADGEAPQHGVVPRVPPRREGQAGGQRVHSSGQPDDQHGVDARGTRRSPSAPQSTRELQRVPPMSKRAPYPVSEPYPGSPQYWRSIEERGRLVDPEAMQRENASEFPKGHFETPPTDEAWLVSRRGLLGAMTATLALVGAEGCRRPIEKIVPYTKMPEDVIPGVPSHYATVIQRRGDALGLVVESHEGRPTKIEGNDAHPSSYGGAGLIARASILELYDPERSTTPRKAGVPASWEDFEKDLGARLSTYVKDQGEKLRLLMPPTISPTVIRLRAALAQRFPKA